MVPARQLYEAAKLIAAIMGTRKPVTELDIFTSSASQYTDDTVSILWVQQLATSYNEKLVDSYRIVIELVRPDDGWDDGSFDDPQEYTVEYTSNTVFDYVELLTGEGDTMLYIPDRWVSHIKKLRDSIPTPWMLPKTRRKTL